MEKLLIHLENVDKKKIAKMTTCRVTTSIEVGKEKDSPKARIGTGGRKITHSKAEIKTDQNGQNPVQN